MNTLEATQEGLGVAQVNNEALRDMEEVLRVKS